MSVTYKVTKMKQIIFGNVMSNWSQKTPKKPTAPKLQILQSAYFRCLMRISWSSMLLVLLIAKSAQHSLSECQRIFLSATRDFMHVCVSLCLCVCVGVGLWCSMYVCVPVLDSSTKCKALHNFNKLKIFLLWRQFLFLILLRLMLRCCRCAAAAAVASFCLCLWNRWLCAFSHFILSFAKKNIRSYFNLTSIYFAHNICSRLCASLCL